MKQSLSEVLNLLKIKGVNWSLQTVDQHDDRMLVPPDRVFTYLVLSGSIRFSVDSGSYAKDVVAEAGEAVFIYSRAGHVRRSVAYAAPIDVCPSNSVSPDSISPTVAAIVSKVVCCALKVGWPGGFDPWRMPGIVKIKGENNPLNMQMLGPSPDITVLGPVLTRAVSFMLVCAIRDHPDCEDLMRAANFRDPIGRAIQYLELYPFNEWTVAGLAMKVGLGRSTFAARFHAETGKSPMELLTGLRMDLSMKLLKETKLKIADVAKRVGYQSSSAFIRRFIAQFDITPGKVRSDSEAGNPRQNQ